MNKLEERILNIIQLDFPINDDPYGEIAKLADCSQQEAHNTVVSLKKQGVIRRIGGSFVAKKMGYESTLVATKVKPEYLSKVANFANQFNEITHNYERDNEFNLWFTIIANSNEKLDAIIDDIKQQQGVIKIYKLPAEKLYKLKVDFKF